MRLVLIIVAALTAFAAPAAAELSIAGEPIQGRLLWGTAPPGATHIRIDDRRVPIAPDGRFVFGVGRDATDPIRITAERDGVTLADETLTPIARTYDIQRIDGLPPKQVTPDPATLTRIGREAGLIKAVRARPADTTRFPVAFTWPVRGTISGVFGSQRILNGNPRSPHRGVDVAAPLGTPVAAPAPGVVRLVHPDMFYTGKTVMLDHGYGVTSVYVHLDAIAVTEGQTVETGDTLGTVGESGRATGPHLHWGVSWFGVHVDPQPLAGPMVEP
jgi:murein DD-endopeptidase MepM/ murein hydrolase activator NlpD